MPGRVTADFIPGDVQIAHHRDALQVGCDLFQRLLFRLFRGEPDGIGFGFSVAHAVVAHPGDDTDLGMALSGQPSPKPRASKSTVPRGERLFFAKPRKKWDAHFCGPIYEHRLTRQNRGCR